ncbi:MAG: phospholipase C, phosphocholine-specific [Zavarzinia sp.]|nr:phospholipase C, phosphocholine-specific [Zavarzinia sp.]
MTDTNRRQFLKSAAALAGAAAVFPESIRRALAIPANNATRSILDVGHVVILMQENRSFDQYFGTMAGVRGFGDRFPIPLRDRLAFPLSSGLKRDVFRQWNGTRIVMPYHLDQATGNAQRVSGTPHTWPDAQAAWDDGRMEDWPAHKQDQSMGYYTEAELGFQWALANAFTLCDAYHCAMHTGTIPNRLFHVTGSNGPVMGRAAVVNEWNYLGSSTEGYEWTTYAERLEAAGVSWMVYQNLPDNFGCNQLASFRQFRRANEAMGNQPNGAPYPAYRSDDDRGNPLYKGTANTMPAGGLLAEFRRDALAGRLPQVSWIVAPPTYSEHPGPSSPVQGGWYVQEALDALTANPDVWAKTVLIVNFDENDGFFDHVPSPALYSMNADGSAAGATTMDEALLGVERFTHPAPEGSSVQPAPDGKVYGPGPRVPCFVVSPWSKGGWVNSQVFDHTSVLRFLETRFGVPEPNISPYRRAVCGDLTTCFDFVDPNVVVPPLPAVSKGAADALRVAQDQQAQVAVPGIFAQSMPAQAKGVKPSRALPYALHATAAVSSDKVTIAFVNEGRQGAVFHVYDRKHLDRIPRRYMVEAGMSLAAEWPISPDLGKYDLWVLGPNGFHRHFIGDTWAYGGQGRPNPEVVAAYDPAAATLRLAIANRGGRSCKVTLTANAYEKRKEVRTIVAGQQWHFARSLKSFGGWYDYSVVIDDGKKFARRLAGRLETGGDTISDPAAILPDFAG